MVIQYRSTTSITSANNWNHYIEDSDSDGFEEVKKILNQNISLAKEFLQGTNNSLRYNKNFMRLYIGLSFESQNKLKRIFKGQHDKELPYFTDSASYSNSARSSHKCKHYETALSPSSFTQAL